MADDEDEKRRRYDEQRSSEPPRLPRDQDPIDVTPRPPKTRRAAAARRRSPLDPEGAGMFGVDSTEFADRRDPRADLHRPKDLPKVMRTVGYWVGRVRGMARHFTSGIENMMREAELEEMEKKWREENERIMRLHPADAHYPEPGQPDEMPPVGRSPIASEELPPEKRPLP